VEAKQRAYLPYIDRELARRFPFLDLGCGRGEFLRILRGEGIAAVGVDSNPVVLAPLHAAGFDVVEQDLLQFLLNDRRTYCGASMLQVAEHLTNDQLERALALLAARLAPRAVLIVETPNPLSPFALAVFHTDPTHVAPLPPERVRYSIEAAGFEDARTLFQARVPQGQFAGPDPLAYYGDYAVIARRCDS
jgi:SAM-dependent methyltransferase